jgi:tetratricopeptide (TPR) repeat protein
MAKRKKLNKRVAILLGVIGAVVVALVLAMAIRMSGSGGLLNRLFPKDPVVLLKKAQDAAEAKDYTNADLAFSDAINAARNVDTGKLPEYYYQYAKFNYDWAMAGTGLTMTQRQERHHRSIQSLQKALGREPTFLKARQFLTDIYWNYSVSQKKGWNEFIKEVDELIKLKGDDHQAYFRRALAKANLASPETPGQLDKEAIEDFQKAISLKKDEPSYWLAMIGFLRSQEGRDAEVEQDYQKAVEAMPSDAKLLIAYAGYLQGKNRLDDARQRLEVAIAKDPVLGNLALADFYSVQGKLEESLKALETARKLDPSDGRTYLRKAGIFSRQALVLAAGAKEPAGSTTRPTSASATQATTGPATEASAKIAQAIAVLKEGLAAVEKAAATQPAGQPRPGQADSRMDLNYMLCDLLLDAVERGDKDRAKLLAEAVERLRIMTTTLGLAGPRRSRINGRIALAQGKIPEAIEELEAAFNAFGTQDMKVANILVNVYLGQRLPGKADAVLDKLLSVPGQQRNVSVLMAKARLLIQYRDFDKADALIARVLQLEPENPEAVSTRMMILSIRGQTPSLAGKGQLSPEATRVLLDRSATLWLDQQREDAIKLVEQLHQNSPKDRVVIHRLFSMYRAVERLTDAEKLLDEAQRYWPDDKTLDARRKLVREKDPAKQFDILMQVAEEYPEPQRSLEKATIAQTMDRPEEYVRYLRQASKIDPNDPGVVERLFRWAVDAKDWKQANDSVLHARKANLDGAAGKIFEARLDVAKQDYDAAIAAALEALKAQPNRKDARVLLGQAYLQKRMFDPAYDQFKTVANNDPAYVPALVGLVAVTLAQGKTDEHRAWVDSAWRLAPQDPYIRQRHFDIERETTTPEDQIKEREKLLKREPNDLGNMASLGGLYERVGRAKDAEDMFLTLHDKSADKLYSARVLCAFYLRKGRLQDVERVIEPMLESKVDPVGVRVLYAELILQQDPAKAKGLLEKAITTNIKDSRGHLGMAHYWVALRDWSRAVECMSAYVALRPEDMGGAKELVRYAIEAGGAESAVAEKRIEEMLQVDPSDAGAITLKGSLALRKGQTQRAMDLYSKAIQDNPNFADPLILRARLFLVLGDPGRAKADLQTAKRLSNRLDVSMQLVDVYLALQDFDNAELVLRETRTTFPSYSPAIDQLINLYLQRQKWRELEELLAQAKKAYPTNPGYWLAEAHMWALRQDQDKRLEAHAQAVKVAPMTVRPVRDYLIALQEAKKFDVLIQASEPYVGKEGFTGWVDAFRATALAKTNRPAEADKAFLNALQVAQPSYVLILVRQLQDAYGAANAPAKFDGWLAGDQGKNWRLYLVLGVLYGEANDSAKALEALSKARDLATDPLARFLAWRHLGSTWYNMGKFNETEKAYLECLKIRDDDVQVLNNLAYLYTNDLNQPRKGLPKAELAAQLSPDNARILDTYGWTLAKIDRMADAEGALVRAVQLEAPLAVSRYHLGWVYEHTGRLEDALKQYRQAFEMIRTNKDDPLYATVKEAVERVTKKLEAGSKK